MSDLAALLRALNMHQYGTSAPQFSWGDGDVPPPMRRFVDEDSITQIPTWQPLPEIDVRDQTYYPGELMAQMSAPKAQEGAGRLPTLSEQANPADSGGWQAPRHVDITNALAQPSTADILAQLQRWSYIK